MVLSVDKVKIWVAALSFGYVGRLSKLRRMWGRHQIVEGRVFMLRMMWGRHQPVVLRCNHRIAQNVRQTLDCHLKVWISQAGGGAWGFSIESGMHAQVSAIQSRFRHAIPLSRCSFRSIVESENDYHFSSSFFENVQEKADPEFFWFADDKRFINFMFSEWNSSILGRNHAIALRILVFRDN